MPTDIAFEPQGEFYVADGYGNSRMVKFAKQGDYLTAWGRKGSGPGEFDTPHSVAVNRLARTAVLASTSSTMSKRNEVLTGLSRA